MFNQKFYYFLLCTFSLLLSSCSEKTESQPVFTFKNLTDRYNSQTGVFTRVYGVDESVSVKVKLTAEEKNQIEDVFRETGFKNLPQIIDCTKWGVQPVHYDELSLNGYTVQYQSSSGDRWFCFKGNRFEKIMSMLQNIVLNKPEVKRLEMSSIFYE